MTSELAGRRILVVEDEVMVSWMLEDMLGQLGCAVVGPASRLDQALAIVDIEHFDAAILDINLNGEKSYPVADALTTRRIPFVFSTGYGRTGLLESYLGCPLLQKPYKRATLCDALGSLLIEGEREVPESTTPPPVWDANRLRIATDAAGVALWSWNVDSDAISMDERAHALWGLPVGPVTFEDMSAHIHPEDLDRVRAAFASTRQILGAYEVEFRILRGKELRWVSARGRGDDQGIVGRQMFGVFLDVTERKMAEEAREMIAGEMGHRVKNLFSIASALTMISERSTTTTKEMSRDLRLRLGALNRAHDLVRPVPGDPERAAHFGDLLAILLAPYAGEERTSGRIRITVPELLVGEVSSTTMALVVHELATNAIKYGALSAATGILDVSCTVDEDDVVVTWTERGGPEVNPPNGNAGFGSRLVVNAVTGQLGGTIAFQWLSEGVVVMLRTSKDRLRA
ncbi:response regulator [Lichenibacterium minor]|uniref:Blue-light-activated histidine kinase n=1 Tax=Lichenibacterium minor TaxID=2316528 RepID=A0A4Q2U1J5_9HYPH|nr:response regulator [Lichenibacterium minor]